LRQARMGASIVSKLLLEIGASPSSQSVGVQLDKPLHRLVSSWVERFHEATVAVFDLLIQASADLEARDDKGRDTFVPFVSNN